MGAVAITTAFDLIFAVGVVVAAVALGAAATAKLSPPALSVVAGLELVAAAAAGVAFALERPPPRALALAAGGLTGCALAAGGAVLVRRALIQAAEVDAHVAEAQQQLRALVAREAAERSTELERALARARADSTS